MHESRPWGISKETQDTTVPETKKEGPKETTGQERYITPPKVPVLFLTRTISRSFALILPTQRTRSISISVSKNPAKDPSLQVIQAERNVIYQIRLIFSSYLGWFSFFLFPFFLFHAAHTTVHTPYIFRR